MSRIELGDLTIDVQRKEIKNIHLSVYPPDGEVRMSAPSKFKLDALRVYAINKLPWIRKQQKQLRAQKRETPRKYANRESHYHRGQRYMLKVKQADAPPSVKLNHEHIYLTVRPGADMMKRRQVLEEWYRTELKMEVARLIETWEVRMKIKVDSFGVKKMRTKWGTCNPDAKRIWVNLELAKKPPICLEYIIVHEMCHLFERTHNERFVGLMDKFMPHWRLHREELNKLPVSHVEWGY